MGWWKQFFSLESPKYFSLEHGKIYSLSDLIEILKTKTVSVGEGNQIVLIILEELVKKHEEQS